MSAFLVGDRVVYVPGHAKGDRSHPDCQRGTVAGISSAAVFVRFGQEGTTAQACSPSDLRLEIDAHLRHLAPYFKRAMAVPDLGDEPALSRQAPTCGERPDSAPERYSHPRLASALTDSEPCVIRQPRKSSVPSEAQIAAAMEFLHEHRHAQLTADLARELLIRALAATTAIGDPDAEPEE